MSFRNPLKSPLKSRSVRAASARSLARTKYTPISGAVSAAIAETNTAAAQLFRVRFRRPGGCLLG